MKGIVKILLALFMMLGLTTAAGLANTRIQGWNMTVVIWTVIVHFLFLSLALLLAMKSRPTENGYRVGLSPGGWIFGSFFSYLVGLGCFFFIK